MNYDQSATSTFPDWRHAYLSLFKSFKYDQGLPFTYQQFANQGFAMYHFDLGNDQSFNADHRTIKFNSQARMDVKFANKPDNEALVMLLYCESNENLMVNGARLASIDYHA